MRAAMLSHSPLLVGENAQVTFRPCRTEKHETGLSVYSEVRIGSGLIGVPFQEPPGTREASTLVTNGR